MWKPDFGDVEVDEPLGGAEVGGTSQFSIAVVGKFRCPLIHVETHELFRSCCHQKQTIVCSCDHIPMLIFAHRGDVCFVQSLFGAIGGQRSLSLVHAEEAYMLDGEPYVAVLPQIEETGVVAGQSDIR